MPWAMSVVVRDLDDAVEGLVVVGHATEHDTVCVVQEHPEGFVALCDGPVDEGYRHGVRVCALGDGDGLRDAGVVMGVSGAPKRGADFTVPQILRFRRFYGSADFTVPQILRFRRFYGADFAVPQILRFRRFCGVQILRLRRFCGVQILQFRRFCGVQILRFRSGQFCACVGVLITVLN